MELKSSLIKWNLKLCMIAEIEFEDGSIETIPRANLEMILT